MPFVSEGRWKGCRGEGGYMLPGVLAALAVMFFLTAGLAAAFAVNLKAQRDFLDYEYAAVLADNAFVRVSAALEADNAFRGWSGEAAPGQGGFCEMTVLTLSERERLLKLRLKWQSFESRYQGRAELSQENGRIISLEYRLLPNDF